MIKVEQVGDSAGKSHKKTPQPVELEENQPCNERLKILDLFSSSKRRLRFN